jgi:hypothetical protein
LKVLLATSPNEHCGIREHSEMLVAAMAEVAPEFEHFLIGPDPHSIPDAPSGGAILHVDHQQGVHGQWRPEHIKRLQESGWRVVVTQHDTYETWEIMASRGFLDARGADALIIHEPVEGLEGGNVHFVRQGVALPWGDTSRVAGAGLLPRSEGARSGAPRQRPVVGTAGFPFPWKGYDALCRAARAANWGVLLIAAGAIVEQCQEWQAANPEAEIIPQWLPREEVVARLAACDATAWLYTSGNSGTSGAIRLGLAARRPLIAYWNRQFRDLADAKFMWALDEGKVSRNLMALAQASEWREWATAGTVEIADRDSWTNVARRYKSIYEGVLGR